MNYLVMMYQLFWRASDSFVASFPTS